MSAAARGMLPHMTWQLFSRLLTFAVQAIAVRAIGPSNFAYSHVRLGLLHAVATIVSGGVRRIAIRARNENVAAALLYIGTLSTCVTAIIAGFLFWLGDRDHGGPIAMAAASAVLAAMSETGVIFARRRERYQQLARARAFASVFGSVASVVAVGVFPKRYVGKYVAPFGHFVHMLVSKFAFDLAAGASLPTIKLWAVREILNDEDVKLALVAVLQQLYDFFHSNAESIVLDVVCADDVKAAYKLAESIGLSLGRFFSDALEEQTFSVFRLLAVSLSHETKAEDKPPSGPVISENSSMTLASNRTQADASQTSSELVSTRNELVLVLRMAIKVALLVYFFLAIVGTSFSYTFLRLLYGIMWADETPATSFLKIYLVFLVFLAVNGVMASLFEATASSQWLKRHSTFSVVLGILHIISLQFLGRTNSATGIIAINCVLVTARIAFSCFYFTDFTGETLRTICAGVPHIGVLLSFILSGIACQTTEHLVYKAFASSETFHVLHCICLHSLAAISAFFVSFIVVLYFEVDFVAFCRSLRVFARKTEDASLHHD